MRRWRRKLRDLGMCSRPASILLHGRIKLFSSSLNLHKPCEATRRPSAWLPPRHQELELPRCSPSLLLRFLLSPPPPPPPPPPLPLPLPPPPPSVPPASPTSPSPPLPSTSLPLSLPSLIPLPALSPSSPAPLATTSAPSA